MHIKQFLSAGESIATSGRVAILVHGRGGTAEDILGIRHKLNLDGYSLIAPQATNYTWYPYSFLELRERNDPWLTSALRLLSDLVDDINKKGVDYGSIFFLGFSQGACLILDFVARNPRRWGGVAALTGGLIGDYVDPTLYKGDFERTPIFLGSSDPDPHVPVSRVNETFSILAAMNANVTKTIYPDMGHTINQDEFDQVNRKIFRSYR